MATVELVTGTALARVRPHEHGRGRDGRGRPARAGRARVARGTGLTGPPPVAGVTGVHRDRLAGREPGARGDGGRRVGRRGVVGVRHVQGEGDVGVVVLVGREGGQAALDEAGVGLGLGGRTRPLGVGAEEGVLALALGQGARRRSTPAAAGSRRSCWGPRRAARSRRRRCRSRWSSSRFGPTNRGRSRYRRDRRSVRCRPRRPPRGQRATRSSAR